MGFVIKVHAVYDRPFWREQGLSGTAFSPYELSHEAYDNTNHGDERGTLVGFVSDRHADDVFTLSAEERKERILESLSHYYGPEAKNPIVYFESDWGSRGVDARRLRRELRPRRAHPVRRRPAHPRRPDPLRLQRHGRRRLPARRRRDPHGSPRRREHHRGGPRMSGHIVVGYTATDAGADAVALGARLAAASDSRARHRRRASRPTAAASSRRPMRATTATSRAGRGVARRRRRSRSGDAVHHAHARPLRRLVRRRPRRRRRRVRRLAHRRRRRERRAARPAPARHRRRASCSTPPSVPVVLAPEGSRRIDPATGITPHHRGDRHAPGRRRAPAREHGARAPRPAPSCGCSRSSRSTCRRASTPASSASPAPPTPTTCSPRRSQHSPTASTPRSWSPEATASKTRSSQLSWEPGELAVVGSSRLAQPRRLFLGSTAAKMLHELPVPMVVVPRTTQTQEGESR